MRLVASLSMLLVASCASQPEFPYTVAGPYGAVRAHDPHLAHTYGEQATILSSHVARLLAVNQIPYEIDIYDTPLADGVIARTVFEWVGQDRDDADVRIELGPDANLYVLAHELTHLHAGGVWKALPHVMEEGLADLVASKCYPGCVPTQWFRESITEALDKDPSLIDLQSISGVDAKRWKGMRAFERSAMYAVGYMLAANIGVEQLREMCMRTAPGENLDIIEFFRRAEIDPNAPDTWIDEI